MLAQRRHLPETSLVVTAAAAAVFLVAWGLIHRFFWAHGQLIDTPTYQSYGDAIVHQGLFPYRDFRVDYPPAALPVFVLPSLIGHYDATFAWLMAACGVGLVCVVGTLRAPAAWFVAVSPLLVGSLILSRFDLWPALLTTAALAALVAGFDRLGWGLLGAAVAAKAWPLVLVPLALVWAWRRRNLPAALIGLAVLVLAVVPFAIVAPHGVWTSVSGQASRPLQIESFGAALLTSFGHPAVATSHGSQNIVGHGALAACFGVLQALAVVGAWIGFARGPATPDRLLRYSAAAVCAFIVFGKVLSPQYLIWLVPLVPLVRGRRGIAATGLLVAALVLTQVWFPFRYWAYALDFHLAGVVLARDLVLLVLLAVLALPSIRVDANSDAAGRAPVQAALD
jgi:uncharacterized membrane protein